MRSGRRLPAKLLLAALLAAAAATALAGPGARFTTGQVLHVNGGAYLGG